MAATDAMIARLRRMIAEPGVETYLSADLAEVIERYPLLDSEGYSSDNADWTATYDLNAAASELWTEKAAALAAEFDFNADGASYSRSQQMAQANRMSRYYGARRAVSTVTLARVTSDDDEVEEL